MVTNCSPRVTARLFQILNQIEFGEETAERIRVGLPVRRYLDVANSGQSGAIRHREFGYQAPALIREIHPVDFGWNLPALVDKNRMAVSAPAQGNVAGHGAENRLPPLTLGRIKIEFSVRIERDDRLPVG